MKKILLISFSLICLTLNAQSDSNKHFFSNYICVGLSMTNTTPVNNFKQTSYPSIENGLIHNNIGLACVIGYRDLHKVCSHFDSLYYEFKTYAVFPIGDFTGQVLFGWGGYFGTSYNFVEYGVGISYTTGKISYAVTYSNWDAVNYVTPSITYNF